MSCVVDDLAVAIRVLTESGDPAATAIAAALDRWRRSRSATLEQAAGWRLNVRAASRVRQRDAAIMHLSRRYPGLSCRALSVQLHEVLTAAARQHGDRRPDGPEGDIWDAVEHGAAALGVDRLRQLLG